MPKSGPSPEAPARRRYTTPKRDQRAAATRAAVLAAAEKMFLRDGYARTSMRAIATQAGVSEKTMYLAFATKATLLRQVIQLRAQGDDAAIPLSERTEWRALVTGPVEEIFVRFAALNATLMTRSAAVMALGEAAAATDPELAEYRDQAHAETRANLGALAAELKRRDVLAPGISEQDAADTIYALATDESVFLRLTRDCGWTPARYADLIAHTLTATLTTRRQAQDTSSQHGTDEFGSH
jgi:AcrR family transcriptional regulator